MKLKLLRRPSKNGLTNGQLYIDDVLFCFTLEDVVREQTDVPVAKWKVQNETAIPRGIYEVVFQNSPRFGVDTITLLNVPGFTGIRIHGGNTPGDTDGCVIVGFRITAEGLIIPGTSQPALAELKRRLKAATDKLVIQIV